MTAWQRMAAFLTAIDAGFDPDDADRARLHALEAKVRKLESDAEPLNDGMQP